MATHGRDDKRFSPHHFEGRDRLPGDQGDVRDATTANRHGDGLTGMQLSTGGQRTQLVRHGDFHIVQVRTLAYARAGEGPARTIQDIVRVVKVVPLTV